MYYEMTLMAFRKTLNIRHKLPGHFSRGYIYYLADIQLPRNTKVVDNPAPTRRSI